MRFSPHSQRLTRSGGSARSGRTTTLSAAKLLGEGHPLVGVLARIEIVAWQLAVVAALHACGLLLWSLQREPGAAVALASLGAEAVLGCRMFLLAQARRHECVTLIAAGGGDLALEPVARERRRLSSRRYRRCLARAVEELAHSQHFGAHALTARPPIAARVVEPARPWLHEIAVTLARDDVSVRGVARLELLISSSMSALYGAEPDQLRREVGQVRYLLWS